MKYIDYKILIGSIKNDRQKLLNLCGDVGNDTELTSDEKDELCLSIGTATADIIDNMSNKTKKSTHAPAVRNAAAFANRIKAAKRRAKEL